MLKIETFIIDSTQTNCYVAYDSESSEGILIDPGAFDSRISDFIKINSIVIKFIINTHGHYDHISGNKAFGYPVLIHEKDRSFLNNPLKNLSLISGSLTAAIKPLRLLKDQDLIHVGVLSFKVVHTPGHTPGGITLECGDVLFTGDTLFYEGIGRTDIPFSSQSDMDGSLDKLMDYKDKTLIYPGHGPSSTIGHERVNNPFLG